MKALVCDLCGGKLQIEKKGVAVCESCGTTHTPQRIKEKIQEIKGVVSIDHSKAIANIMILAQNSYENSDYNETIEHCNKVIGLDSRNYSAWLLKGKAIGWSSEIDNVHFEEAVRAFGIAADNAGENKAAVCKEASEEIQRLGHALVSTRSKRFARWPDLEEASGLLNDLIIVSRSFIQFITTTSTPIDADAFNAPIVEIIADCVKRALDEVIVPAYEGDDGHPDREALVTFLKSLDCCVVLLKGTIKLRNGDDESDIALAKLIIRLQDLKINACAWDYNWGLSNTTGYREKKFYISNSLNDEAVKECKAIQDEYRSLIQKLQSKADEKKNAAIAQRREAYWNAHVDERRELEQQQKAFFQQIQGLKGKRETLELALQESPQKLDLQYWKERIEYLKTQIDNCGLFHRKEKRIYKHQLEEAENAESESLEKEQQYFSDIQYQIAQLDSKIQEYQSLLNKIELELTKER